MSKRFLSHLIVFSLLLLVGVGLFVAPVGAVSSQDTFGITEFGQETVLGSEDIRVTIAKIIRAILGFLGVIAVVIVLYGGYEYMTSGGSEEKVLRGRQIIINGVIGLAIILSAFSIAHFVLRQLSAATGSGTVPGNGDGGPGGGGTNLSCSMNPALCCARENFVVKSITPRTEATNINNVTPRVVLSQPTRNAANEVMRIYRGDAEITNQFSYRFVDGSNSTVVEATYTGTSEC